MGIDVSAGSLMLMIFFSLIGLVYIKQGKTEGPMSHVIYGITLLIYPYFVTDLLPMLLVGLAIMALSYFFSFG
jgi:hypothetical protein